MFKRLIFVFSVSSFSTRVEAGPDVVGRLGQRPAADVTVARFDVKEAEKLIARGEHQEALRLLRTATSADDIYECTCNDAPHKHRSAVRRLLLVDCLLNLGSKEEARRELRSLYEETALPAYIVPGKANLLLIELETSDGYEGFEIWLKKHCPVGVKDYERSMQHIVSLKKDIESGRYDEARQILQILGGIEQDDTFVTPRRFVWQHEALISYIRKSPEALRFLLPQMLTERNGRIYPLNRGVIYCLGEIGNPQTIPALRSALRSDKNYYTQREV